MSRIIPLRNLPLFSVINPPNPDFAFNKGAVFLINKPEAWSSFDVVKHLRKCVNLSKVGHAGTLDPMATGLIILCCGKATRTIAEIQGAPKAYEAEITFGASTPSFDAETEIDAKAPTDHITRPKIMAALEEYYSGDIKQLPPMFSALKKDGTPLYKLARQGKSVKRKPREVSIYAARIISFDLPKVTLYIKCSKGTYIRAIADRLGKKLNSLGHLTALRRKAIGKFHANEAFSIEDLNLIFSV